MGKRFELKGGTSAQEQVKRLRCCVAEEAGVSLRGVSLHAATSREEHPKTYFTVNDVAPDTDTVALIVPWCEALIVWDFARRRDLYRSAASVTALMRRELFYGNTNGSGSKAEAPGSAAAGDADAIRRPSREVSVKTTA